MVRRKVTPKKIDMDKTPQKDKSALRNLLSPEDRRQQSPQPGTSRNQPSTSGFLSPFTTPLRFSQRRVPQRNRQSRNQPSTSGSRSPSTTPPRSSPRGVPRGVPRGYEVVTRKRRDNLYYLPQPRPAKRRAKPGKRVLAEIKKLQRTTNLLIPKAPFARVAREVLKEMSRDEKRLTEEALGALRESTEAFLITIFECMNRCANHARRVTIMPSDLNLTRFVLIAFNAYSFG